MSTPPHDPQVALAAPPVRKREIFGWAMYDFANSSYTTVVISLLYSAFFVEQIVPASGGLRDTYWSIAIVASTLLAIILSPLVGALCDFGGHKKRYLGLVTVACALSTIALAIVDPGEIWLGVVFIALSNSAFMIGEAFCGSFLPELATRKNMGLISGLGWGLGYFGGLASLVLVMFIVTADPAAEQAAYVGQTQAAMIAIGVFYLIAALPTFLLVRERARPAPGFEHASLGRLLKVGLTELASSYRLARHYPTLFRFFLAFTVYMAGLEVVMKFIGIYASGELRMSTGDLIELFLILQIAAAAGALGFGYLEGKLGAKKTVLLTLVWWIAGIAGIYFLDALAGALASDPITVFKGIAVVAGAGMGSIQSSSRTVVGLLAPADRSAQMFGFWGMFMRLALLLAMVFGPVADALGSRRDALLLVIAFFAIGGLMLLRVPLDEASEHADAPTG
ncbi:MAG: MFS transporter [Myxococcales bacterium]|nr:MFS transporter [Myxococcales bacterium]MCB9566078.1 MFS transporter [Myxococcales bacterium]MCB9703935.1 MFS transporter [Myxococcales bacterium]